MAKHIKLGLPDKIEGLMFLAYILFWYWFNDAVNIMSRAPEGWQATGTIITGVTIPLIYVAWVAFGLFHVALFAVVGRSIWRRGTNHFLDLFAGIIIFLGVFLLLIPTIVMLMGYSGDYLIPWFFNLGRTTVYHIGVGIQIIGMIYFALTR